ncbi:Membrane-anchored protein YidD [Commensalibacter communis]|uniref:Putative membrane protein insertion efficiency factor n=1 Tax=Commensalibacter communis TaxID=2972786 RepID=A0A9W4X746_9PROT|nr:membrane protein insertion efficiency factor YidD [Commensalibacter communis]CAI3923825.1 Membrane-anchored protein YidD [Commensalibacter communis]CAI3924339.1 Membrane-anchored protein YidD [Commensalibacter communis]CAI3936532.1 Membrane-anchored protein YidD [Commensalibacter communis]CAI3946120.1 Membrane-anchored protein YidD [Commensalibacter communis]CAI3946314.1 Membrane-anchored protein YidD [Commensalibacter communis]
MKRIFIGLIYIYQLTLRPLLGHHCRFNPSCSHYTQKAIQTHGVFKGIMLGGWRILRCNPWNLGGEDPVPPKK